MGVLHAGFSEDGRQCPLGDSHHGAPRGVPVPKVKGTIRGRVSRQGKCVQNQFELVWNREEHRFACFLSVKEDSPCRLLFVPSNRIFFQGVHAGNAKGRVAESRLAHVNRSLRDALK